MLISPLHTACKNCSFAKYKDNTQVGCDLNMLAKYKSKNAEILEVYDEEKEFYVINNKKCLFYREPKYFYNRLKNNTKKNRLDYIKNHMHIRYGLVINVNNFSKSSLFKLENLFNTLSIQPSRTYLIRYTNKDKDYPYELLHEFIENSKIKNWQIKTMLHDTHFYNVVDNITNLIRDCRFVCCVNKDPSNLCNIIDMAQKIVYEDLSNFYAISNKNYDSILFNRSVYSTSKINGIDLFSAKDRYLII